MTDLRWAIALAVGACPYPITDRGYVLHTESGPCLCPMAAVSYADIAFDPEVEGVAPVHVAAVLGQSVGFVTSFAAGFDGDLLYFPDSSTGYQMGAEFRRYLIGA